MTGILEHDYEPEPGLPQELPESERMLWQGKPDFEALARTTFHVRKLGVYFAALLALRLFFQLGEGRPLADAMVGTAALAVLAGIAIGLLTLYAWLSARTTMYTVTNRRVVIRCGVAVPVTVNLPYSKLVSADLRRHGDGSGDLALVPEAGSRVSYVLLWPYVKPWRFLRVRPVMRGIEGVDTVVDKLGAALRASVTDAPAETGRAPAAEQPAKPAIAARNWYTYPTAPLAAAVSLVVLALVAVAWIRLSGIEPGSQSSTPVVAAVELYFEDREDGSVIVTDAATGETVDVLEPGSNGFLRSTLRSFVRTRNQVGAGDDLPFSVLRKANGRLILADPATDREVDLWAFGETNARAFARFLPGGADSEAGTAALQRPADDSHGEKTAALNQQERRQ